MNQISSDFIEKLNPSKVILEFFEAYLLTEIHDWSKHQILNHAVHAAIDKEFEKKVGAFCRRVELWAGLSIQRELNHFLYEKRSKWVYNVGNKESKRIESLIESDKPLEDKLFIFSIKKAWNSAYGGKAWAQAGEMWRSLKKAKTTRDKFYWCDRLLDHEHNTGNFLNKTYFAPITKGILDFRYHMPSALVVNHLLRSKVAARYERSIKLPAFPTFSLKDLLELSKRTINFKSLWGCSYRSNGHLPVLERRKLSQNYKQFCKFTGKKYKTNSSVYG